MTDVLEIEKAVQKLDATSLSAFSAWFTQFNENAWDARIAQDASAGRLDGFAADAMASYKAGKVRTL